MMLYSFGGDVDFLGEAALVWCYCLLDVELGKWTGWLGDRSDCLVPTNLSTTRTAFGFAVSTKYSLMRHLCISVSRWRYHRL